MEAILKQTSWLFFAQALARIIGFFYIVYLARTLGVFDFGLYTAALAYFYLISSIADFGFNRFLIREIAKDESKIVDLFSSISLIRFVLSSLIFAVFALTMYFFDPDKMRINISLLVVLAVIPQALGQTIDGIFIAIGKLKFSAIVLLITSLTTAILGIIFVNFGFGSSGAAIALICGQLIYFFFLLHLLRKQEVGLLSSLTLPFLKKIISGSFRYGILIVLGLVYFRVDVLLLSYLKGNFDTGIYGVGYKFLEVALVFPTALSTAIFPLFSRLNENSSNAYKFYKRSIIILGIVSLLVSAVYLTLLPEFIKAFLPNYILSIDVIKILSLSIPFFFISSLQATLLMSREKLLNYLIGISTFMIFFVVILNAILIPKFSFIGAAWVTLASEVIVFLIFSILIKKHIS